VPGRRGFEPEGQGALGDIERIVVRKRQDICTMPSTRTAFCWWNTVFTPRNVSLIAACLVSRAHPDACQECLAILVWGLEWKVDQPDLWSDLVPEQICRRSRGDPRSGGDQNGRI
jgi:hypothetical protein